MYWHVIFSCLLYSVLCDDPQSRLVNLEQGPVRGYKDVDDGVFVFNSIPYATAPTGRERFKDPLPPPSWSETFEAVEKDILCPQGNFMPTAPLNKNVRENCLIVNIYVPEKINSKLPVVVYVHGGAYILGSGNMFKPKKLVKSNKIIAVTFNYRLGAHGFLCLGTKEVPGNAGMKDQVALLRWVNKNIGKFGGNADEVTIAGYSAGSSAVDLIMISKMAQGLFKRVIPESGANTAAFSIQSDPIKNAKEYAKMLNFDDTDFDALQDFFLTVSYEKLNSPNLLDRTDSIFLMSPCVERDVGQERFLDDNPVSILKTGNYEKLPMLYGFAEMEGIFRVHLFEIWKNRINEKFSDFLPADLQFTDDNEKEQVAKKIKHFYFGNKSIDKESILAFVDYFTDVIFAYPTLRSVKMHVDNGHNQIYLYEYSFVSDNDTPVIPNTNVRGASHCAQTFAVLDGYWNETIKDEKSISTEFKKNKEITRELWVNFITTGNPVPINSKLPEWRPVGPDWSPHMSIDKSLELRGSLLKKRTLFWEEIYDKYYRFPLEPPVPSANKGKSEL